MHQSLRFRIALLEILTNLEGEWMALNDAMELAKNTSKVKLQYSTLKATRQAMKYEGLVEVRQGSDRHWEIRATDKGEAYEEPEPEPEWEGPGPEVPFRIGKGHLLPKEPYARLIEAVRQGRVDLIVVPHDKPIGGAGYWDE
jgi:hypothetical protein